MACILLVEDDADERVAFASALTREGHTVVAVSSAEAALARLESDRFDVLALDLLLPGIDGAELSRMIRADERWADLPVVMISNMPAQMGISITPEDAAWAPVDCFVDKASSLSDLVSAVQRHVAAPPRRR